MTPEMPKSGLAAVMDQVDAGPMNKTHRLPRPRCERIDPDMDNKGYWCRRCGYDLTETRTGWFRHGDEFRHEQGSQP